MLTGRVPVILDDDYVAALRELGTYDDEVRAVAFGWPLFMSAGLDLTGPIQQSGRSVFLDLGLASSARELSSVLSVASTLGVDYVSVHSRSLETTMEPAREAGVEPVVHVGLSGEEDVMPQATVQRRCRQAIEQGARIVSLPAGVEVPELPDTVTVLEMAGDRQSYTVVSNPIENA